MTVFIKLLSFYSELQELKCHTIHPPQKVQCVHMYSMACDALVVYTNCYLAVFDYVIFRLQLAERKLSKTFLTFRASALPTVLRLKPTFPISK